ncbi:RNA polymerase sigma factor [Roseivirga sp.]|uniref:RNA polymerase sigma factor n=1 Tax=Roseivirga sp. TaxID=1964215 RepID=UPI003B51B74A
MSKTELIPHLFRTEYGKLVSVLCKYFGLSHIEIAEDIVSNTFQKALETWPYHGVPDNPQAWLYTVAKNQAFTWIKRQQTFTEKVSKSLETEEDMSISIDLNEHTIEDSQLRMLYAIAHPSISQESQIAMALRILCGFGVDEIASAFLCTKETINKRLYRAKKKLRDADIRLVLPEKHEIQQRTNTVLLTLYLLFNEGYYSESTEHLIRKDLCLEAMRLNYLLLSNSITQDHNTYALMALMCFQASRLDARQNEQGELILYEDQNTGLWSNELIEKGFYYLRKASIEEIPGKYYLEASIAYWHTIQEDSVEKWRSILSLYDALLLLEPSPVIELNRIYALSKVEGIDAAINSGSQLALTNNPFYHILMSNLTQVCDPKTSLHHLNRAIELSQSNRQKQWLQKQLLKYSL